MINESDSSSVSTPLEPVTSSPTRSYAELDRLYEEAVAYVRHVEADYQQSQAQLRHVEAIYAEIAVYAKQLEQSITDHTRVAAETSGYIAQIESELASLRQAHDEGRVYAESLLAQIHRLEVKLHDLEENLRQYREG